MDAGDIHKARSKRGDISFRANSNSSSLWRNTGTQVFSRSSRDEDDEEALKWAALEKLPTFDRLRKGLVGIDIPTIEVRYEHLNVDAEAYSASRALPTFVNFNINIIQGILSSLHILPSGKKPFTILKDVSGIIKPCRMTLLLEMLAELSRREKAANIKPDPDVDMYMKAAATEGDEENIVTDYILKVLGLDICADTLVGDETIRGISGGQKKRVTTGEMLVGPAKAFFMDEISTGLDSSTTYQIVNMLRQYVHIMKGTTFISLLQPTPRRMIYSMTSCSCLMARLFIRVLEKMCYTFFESMGFKCPARKGVADFLQEVTSKKDQQQYWAHKDEPCRFISASDFSEAFQSFVVGRRLGDELATPFDKSKSHPAALSTQKYGIGKKELLKACIDRELLLMKRNSFLTLMTLITMTLFLRTKMHKDTLEDGGVYTGALFFTVIMAMFNGMSELSMTIYKLPVFYKQRDMFFFPPWAYVIPSWILKIPVTFLEVGIWTFLTYYVIGFDPNAGRLMKQYLLLLLVRQASSALFRFIGAAVDVKKWWLWGYWSSPLMYAQNAILVNEFTGHSWSKKLRMIPKGIDLSPEFQLKVLMRVRRSIEANENRKRGMVLPFEPESLTFYDIRYSVDMPPEMKAQGATEDKLELLKGVSGYFRPGVLTALMGVSGAGKTTLMDVLAGRKTGGYIEGNITISGYPKNQATFARISGYCEQNDIHSPNVTVYESLVYSAWLRLPQEVNAETRKIFIAEVMELVELNSLREALVGLPGVSGLSTEQRKRLTIAVELVANPSIIFMDEPTSGLDARAAAIVMRTVRNTVNTGRTVVCTIHQPSIDIFEAFDELFLMKRGGQEIYAGPLGRHSSHLIKYFEGMEGVPMIKDGYNPATWMLEVTTSAQELVLGVDFADHYRNSELYTRNKALIKELSVPRPGTKDLYFSNQYSQSFLTQCTACLWKQHWSYWRNPPYTAVRFLFTIFLALIFGTMFWDLGSKWNTRQDLFNAMGSMYAAILFLGFQYGSTVQPVVSIERTVFYRERAAGMYSALPYAFSQCLIEIPYVFIQSMVYGLIVYSMMGFDWNAKKFFWFIYFLFFSLLYFVLYGMTTVAVTPNYNVAAVISTFFYLIWNLFSGFVIPRPRMPVWWRWYYWATPVAYTLYGFIVSQFGEIHDQMESGETVEQFLRDYFGFRHDMLGVVAAILLGFVVIFAFIFAYSIRAFNFQRR
ncbi:hypothetical protein DH2020_036487 [Rehmannia glutinosa]|uniref:ABC transporter domain-containing protein n=1 Tax=Rehmannia glutinosa TaxID=99300 RepID=A0ABR0V5U3_REHGL